MMERSTLKMLGGLMLVVPLAMLVLFAFGEGWESWDAGWLHIAEAAAIGVLGVVAWNYPKAGGYLLALIGATVGIFYALTIGEFQAMATRGYSDAAMIVAEVALFGSMVVSGLLIANAEEGHVYNAQHA